MNRQISPRELLTLWKIYIEFRRPQIAPSTYARDYAKFTKRLEKLVSQSPHLTTAIEIRDWLLQNYSAEITRRSLQQFSAACKHAMISEIRDSNPFEGLPQQFRKPRQSERAWAAFTARERDIIIQTFESTEPFYAPWVKMLFWTGARPEELAALKWEHVSRDNREILIAEALPIGQTEAQGTKNLRVTRFPCNHRLQHLLAEQRGNGSPFVVPGRKGDRLNYQNFQTRYWKPTVRSLCDRGLVAFYLSQYHARHTWITLALDHLAIADIAYLARVSPGIIYKHYAGRSRSIIIPEF